MKPEEAIEIISNYRPGCGEKITYAEGEVCEAYDVTRSPERNIFVQKPWSVSCPVRCLRNAM